MGSGPAPAREIMAPQNGWSPKKGTTSVGLPRLMPAALVAAPPWWTTHDTRWNSQSWGQLPSMKPPAGRPMASPPMPPQPLETRAHTPAMEMAWKIISVRWFGSSTTMDPKPMYTGGGPASRKAARSGSGVDDDARDRK